MKTNQKKPTVNNHREYIYNPSRAITSSLKEYEHRQKSNYLDWGIPEIDDRVIPPLPGDLITIQGRPGMGKSMACIYLARRFANQIRNNVSDNKTIIVYATWETRVEEFMAIYSSKFTNYSLEDIGRGKANLKNIEKAFISDVIKDNIFVFGQSMENHRKPDPPNLVELDLALGDLIEDGYTIAALIVDYLQLIPHVDFSGKLVYGGLEHYGIGVNLQRCKRIGVKYGTPTFVAVQSRRDVDDYDGIKLPSMRDGYGASQIEKDSDKMFSITIPSKYLEVGTEFNVNDLIYEVQKETFIMKMTKQRFGPQDISDKWVLSLNPIAIDLTPQTPLRDYIPEEEEFHNEPF